jgi:hypothetical protein
MKRTAVILGIAIAALVAPGAASATGVIQQGFGSSPGSVRPLTGVIVSGISTSPGRLRPRTGVIVQGFGTSPHSGIIVNRLRLLPQTGVLQQ